MVLRPFIVPVGTTRNWLAAIRLSRKKIMRGAYLLACCSTRYTATSIVQAGINWVGHWRMTVVECFTVLLISPVSCLLATCRATSSLLSTHIVASSLPVELAWLSTIVVVRLCSGLCWSSCVYVPHALVIFGRKRIPFCGLCFLRRKCTSFTEWKVQ